MSASLESRTSCESTIKTLPERLANAEPQAPAERYQEQSSPKPVRRVMIVDDETKIISALRRLLRQEDYEIVTANTGNEALALLEAQPVSLIISDFRMPSMNGVDLLHEVCKRWPETIRIILSGYSEVKAIISAINEGAIYKFMTKPWNDEEIKLNIRRALEQHELELENKRLTDDIAAQNDRLKELNELLKVQVTDASAGLSSSQELLECMGAGVLALDDSDLIVGANHCANRMIATGSAELIGLPAQLALPPAMCDMIGQARTSDTHGVACDFELNDRHLQCRMNPFEVQGVRRGSVITIWENTR
jgi:FixJ family two-component response regulator